MPHGAETDNRIRPESASGRRSLSKNRAKSLVEIAIERGQIDIFATNRIRLVSVISRITNIDFRLGIFPLFFSFTSRFLAFEKLDFLIWE